MAVAWGMGQGCGGDSTISVFDGGGGDPDGSSALDDSGDLAPDVHFIGGGDSGGTSLAIAVQPATATIDVTVADGVITPATATFTAVNAVSGAPLPGATWEVDRGELGSVSGAGLFSAKGQLSGTVKVIARYGGAAANATVTLRIKATNSGGNANSGIGPQSGPTPIGGFNGVGGQVIGVAPDTATKTLLGGTNVVPVAQFEWLYPYNKTVFPRGTLSPLVQWRTKKADNSAFNVTGYYVHLKQDGYEFEGYYAKSPTGAFLTSQPVDEEVWKHITASNHGDPLHVEIKVTDGATVYGALSQDWNIAPGILRGTVYYNSYGTLLANITQNNKAAAVLRIKPGDPSPALAVPGSEGKCVVCHEVSADGSRLFSNDTDQGDYGYSRAYDLTNNSSVVKSYTPASMSLSSDQVIGKVTYSGPYPDGKFFLASSGENYHHYTHDSDLFSADTMKPITTTGFTTVVKQAVTPAFSPDGTRVAFNFWTAQATNAMADGGHTLVAMDFNCGATTLGGTCAAPPYAFTGMRQLHRDVTAYLGWPSFTPDAKSVLFQRSTHAGDGSVLNTSGHGRADLWIASAETTAAFTPQKLCALNGLNSDCTTSYLPTGTNHPQLFVDDANPGDTNVNFEPTVTPIASGGYYWVIFTSRRLYGNVATLQPYAGGDDGQVMPSTPVPKKLWVAAIDINPQPGVDPSHPAFYLPGQELLAGNMRGFWENDPCHKNGTSCETGDECCNGFCRDGSGTDSGGGLVCTDKPAQGCAQEFENCNVDADCCGVGGGIKCIGGKCARSSPI